MKALKVVQDLSEYADNCVRINPDVISSEFSKTPSDLYFWNSEYAEAVDKETRAEANRKEIAATVYLELRACKEGGGKGITEEGIKNSILVDARYKMALELEHTAAAHKLQVMGVVDAVRAKRDLLISLGATMRQEREMVIKDQ